MVQLVRFAQLGIRRCILLLVGMSYSWLMSKLQPFATHFSNLPKPLGPCATEPIIAATDENSHISCGAGGIKCSGLTNLFKLGKYSCEAPQKII